ncbi:MAG: hypothetical protein PHY05_02035, partial [Methanothrix sp.]|nr:hypothetical protein [Methanothrix sp.]
PGSISIMSPADAPSIASWMLWPGFREIIDAWAAVASINTARQQQSMQIGDDFFIMAFLASPI